MAQESIKVSKRCTAADIKRLREAYYVIYEAYPRLYICGHYKDDTDNWVFLAQSPAQIVGIDRKYITVDLGPGEGLCKIDPTSGRDGDHKYIELRAQK